MNPVKILADGAPNKLPPTSHQGACLPKTRDWGTQPLCQERKPFPDSAFRLPQITELAIIGGTGKYRGVDGYVVSGLGVDISPSADGSILAFPKEFHLA